MWNYFTQPKFIFSGQNLVEIHIKNINVSLVTLKQKLFNFGVKGERRNPSIPHDRAKGKNCP